MNSDAYYIPQKRSMFGDAMKFGLLLICLLLTTGFVVAQENATNETTVSTENITNISASAVHSAAIEARYEHVNYGYEKTLTAMDTIITYLDGTDTEVSTLFEVKDNFTSLFNGLQSYVDANDPAGFGKDVAGMHKIAAQFKRETAQVVAPGEVGNLRRLVLNKTEEKVRGANMTAIKIIICQTPRFKFKACLLYFQIVL